MLTRGLFMGMTDADLKELKSLKRNAGRIALVSSWEENWDDARFQDTDKSWKMLFHVLREPIYRKSKLRADLSNDYNTRWLAEIVDVGSELFYGPNLYKADSHLLSFVDKRKLSVLNAHLRNVEPKFLETRFECCVRYWLADYGVEFDKATVQYVNNWLKRLQGFLESAEENEWHVLFSADNC